MTGDWLLVNQSTSSVRSQLVPNGSNDAHQHARSVTYSDKHSHRHPHSNHHSNAHRHGYSDGDRNAYRYTDPDNYPHGYGNAHRHGYSNGHSDAHRYGHSDDYFIYTNNPHCWHAKPSVSMGRSRVPNNHCANVLLWSG